MKAVQYQIVERAKDFPLSVSAASDFVLGPGQAIDAGVLAKEARFSLYCLDFDRQVALFVELPADVDLSQAAFVYVAQYDKAISVVSLSFDALLQLAPKVPLPRNLTMLYSTGRCGSTLASRILAQIDDVWSISEPDSLINLIMQSRSMDEAQLAGLIDAVMRFTCLPATSAGIENVVIKPRSELVFLMSEIAKVVPEMRNLFMYRDAAGYANSLYRMIQRVGGGQEDMDTPENRARTIYFATANGVAKGVDALQTVRPDGLNWLDLIAMAWMLRMRAYEQAKADGIDVVPIEYGALNSDRHAQTERLLAACGLDTGATDQAMAAFERDAHAGSQTGNANPAQDLSDAERAQVVDIVGLWQAAG